MLEQKEMTPLDYCHLFEEEERIEKEAKILLLRKEYYDMLIDILKHDYQINNINAHTTNQQKKVIRYLGYLYKIINEYAKKNYIYQKTDDEKFNNDNSYYVKYKDTYFIIGIHTDKDTSTYNYCILTAPTDELTVINIEDIINNKDKLDPLNIKKDLQGFENGITELIQKGVPPTALKETFRRVLKK